jgi:hypothetical protein
MRTFGNPQFTRFNFPLPGERDVHGVVTTIVDTVVVEMPTPPIPVTTAPAPAPGTYILNAADVIKAALDQAGADGFTSILLDWTSIEVLTK